VQIIIPMSGFGERFRRAGYAVPKPLIEIDGKPIIAHVIDMFPGEENFTFICNEDHLSNPDFRMSEILQKYCPTGRIVGIAAHKLGPVHAVMQIVDAIDSTEPVVVNYCDFTCYWDWSHFRQFVAQCRCDGAIPAYRGFHPHSLGTTNYAYMKENDGWVEDIQEKQPYTDNRLDEFASSGTYYYASGEILKAAFSATVDQQLLVGGEYYASLTYKPMLAKQLAVAVYPLQHFMQWGTPEDVAEYNGWSRAFTRLLAGSSSSERASQGAVIIPMAGLGSRFTQQGFTRSKPLIDVSGKPMVIQATDDLPAADQYGFITRQDMPGREQVTSMLRQTYPQAVIGVLDELTDGQACTAIEGVEEVQRTLGVVAEPVTVGACDNGVLYDLDEYVRLVNDPEVDVIVWGARGHASAVRKPESYGWIDEQGGEISNVSVKKPLQSPESDAVIVGTFTFKRAEVFRQAVASLIARDGRINNEFYIDTCINDAIALGYRCVLFEVEHYLSWGTPDELRTFEYWQSCFHKWPGHAYRLENDDRVPPDRVAELSADYATRVPDIPDRPQ
jgi:NDP-sugar pyrophosphorylase family protein